MKIKDEEKLNLEKEQLEKLKNQLDDKNKEELDKMIQDGVSLSDIIKHFMTAGLSQPENDFEQILLSILKRNDLSEKEKMDVIVSKLNNDERKIFGQMLSEGKTIEEIIKVLADNKRISCQQNGHVSVSDILNNSDLSIEQKFELLKGNMKSAELDQIQKLLSEGRVDAGVFQTKNNNNANG